MKLMTTALASVLFSALASAEEGKPRPDPKPSPDVLEVTPQLYAYTTHLLFGEVWKRPQLVPRDRSLITLAALLASGHCYMTGSEISAMSERRILGGHEHALPADIFPEDLAYVALGHLHKAQRVAKREGLRYSGSPIPLSFSEANYKHQVVIADIEGRELQGVRTLGIPRSVDMIRIQPAPIDAVVEELEALEALEDKQDPARPFLDVTVLLDEPIADLRARIEEACVGKRARLLRIAVQSTGSGNALADEVHQTRLSELRPEDVFVRRYQRDYEGDVPKELIDAFHELLRTVHEGADT